MANQRQKKREGWKTKVTTETRIGNGARGSSGRQPGAVVARPLRLKRPRKKSAKQIPRRLKSARDDNDKGLIGTTEQAAEKVRTADPSRTEVRSG